MCLAKAGIFCILKMGIVLALISEGCYEDQTD